MKKIVYSSYVVSRMNRERTGQLIAPSKRWYDQDPTVSLAVSIFRNLSQKKQLLASEFIIKKGREYDIEIVEPEDGFKKFLKRWYDKEDRLSKAMEYLKQAPPELQKAFAVEIIDHIYTLDCTASQKNV